MGLKVNDFSICHHGMALPEALSDAHTCAEMAYAQGRLAVGVAHRHVGEDYAGEGRVFHAAYGDTCAEQGCELTFGAVSHVGLHARD